MADRAWMDPGVPVDVGIAIVVTISAARIDRTEMRMLDAMCKAYEPWGRIRKLICVRGPCSSSAGLTGTVASRIERLIRGINTKLPLSCILLCSPLDQSFTNLVVTVINLELCRPEVIVSLHVVEQSQARFPQDAPGNLVVVGVPGVQPERIRSSKAIQTVLTSQAVAACTNEALCLANDLI